MPAGAIARIGKVAPYPPPDPGHWVSAVAFSPDGARLAIGDVAGNVKVCDARTGEVWSSFRAHEGEVVGVHLDGEKLFTAAKTGFVKSFDVSAKNVADGREVFLSRMSSPGERDDIYAATFDTSVAVLTGREMTVVDTADSRVRDSWKGEGIAGDVVLSRDGKFVLWGGHDLVGLRDTTAKKTVWSMSAEDLRRRGGPRAGRLTFPLRATMSPDGEYVAVVMVRGRNDQSYLEVFGAESRRSVTHLLIDDDFACCAFTPDGKRLVTAGSDGIVKLWDIQNAKVLKSFEGHEGRIEHLAVSRDGSLAASGCWDGTVIVWPIKPGVE